MQRAWPVLKRHHLEEKRSHFIIPVFHKAKVHKSSGSHFSVSSDLIETDLTCSVS